MTECLESTCGADVTDGTRPDQIRVEPRLWPAGPLRMRRNATTAPDGRPDFSSCGLDVLVAGDPVDDSIVPATFTAPVDSNGDVFNNGLQRVVLGDGRTALYARPATNPLILTDAAVGAANQTGNVGAADLRLGIGGTASLLHRAGPIRRLVKVSVTVTQFRLGAMSWSFNDQGGTTQTIAASPPVSYQIDTAGNIDAGATSTPLSQSGIDIGMNGTTELGAWIIAPDALIEYSVTPYLFYTAPVPNVFGFQGGTLTLRFEIHELAGLDIV